AFLYVMTTSSRCLSASFVSSVLYWCWPHHARIPLPEAIACASELRREPWKTSMPCYLLQQPGRWRGRRHSTKTTGELPFTFPPTTACPHQASSQKALPTQ